MIRAYLYKGRHRMWRYSCISVADLLDGYEWSFPECGVVELRSLLSLPSALACEKRNGRLFGVPWLAEEMAA